MGVLIDVGISHLAPVHHGGLWAPYEASADICTLSLPFMARSASDQIGGF